MSNQSSQGVGILVAAFTDEEAAEKTAAVNHEGIALGQVEADEDAADLDDESKG